MDIQKLKAEFEQLPEINQWISALRYGEKTGVYIAIDNDRHDGVANWVNGAWWAWQAAKAQAVPEGFVIVPKEPTDEMWSSGIDAYADAMEGNKTLPAISIVDIYKAMIEAQEPK